MFPRGFPEIFMRYSSKVRIRKDYSNKDGRSSIYLQVIINRKPYKIDLTVTWPQKKFDSVKGLCRPLSRTDKTYQDCNLVINQALAKANEVFIHFRLTNQPITFESFKQSFETEISKDSFTSYFEGKLKERWKKRKIKSYNTFRNQKLTLTKLKNYKNDILFADLNHEFAENFDLWLEFDQKLTNLNSRWQHHKNLRAYLNLAKKDFILFDDPYQYFNIKKQQSSWKPINKDIFNQLLTYYDNKEISYREKVVLRRFLFMCLTSLRISDMLRMKRSYYNERNHVLEFTAFKTRYQNKTFRMKLIPLARRLMEDELIDKKTEGIFNKFLEQPSNRILKEIGEKLEIKQKLHHHVGRNTFATLYLEFGGSLELLQKYMLHTKISTTMKYVKISEERLDKGIDIMEKISNS